MVVTGDVTMDWNLARVRRAEGSGAAWTAEDTTEGYVQPGGAALLAKLLEAAVAGMQPRRGARIKVERPKPSIPCLPDDPHFHHSFVLWSSFPYRRGSDEGKPAWRVREFLGLDRPTGEPKAHAGSTTVVGPSDAEVVVLDDADLGFRDKPQLWRGLLAPREPPPWIVLKMASRVARGALWERLLRDWAERLVVVMTVNDLRRTAVQISRELSWERTAEDLVREFVRNPNVNGLSHCAHVIVSLYTDGAVLLSKRPTPGGPGDQTEPECSLFFDPKTIEGVWAQDHEGKMFGYTTCLTASIARELLRAPERPELDVAIQRGLAAMRTLHREGYGSREDQPDDEDQQEDRRAELAFPIEAVAGELAGKADDSPFAVAQVPFGSSGSWTILQDRYPGGLEELARRIAIDGCLATVKDVPIGRFGKLNTVERSEIEGYRSIRALIGEYRRRRPTTPLSIAVFGPPGAGKSFGVVQVARSLLADDDGAEIKELTFNLSQLNDASELYSAFHQIRDECLAGKLPLVFWDEFDTKLADVPYGWLRHFLVPMQDGTFQQAQIVHSLGTAIFVFAGGTKKRVEDFAANKSDEFVLAKGPDFVSRLKGYVNVIGPNPREDDPAADPYYLIRRALLLRSMLERDRPDLFDRRSGERLRIDAAVLRAFLRTRAYQHGARSMESIVAMSLLHGKTHFERSALPAAEQLELHVDAADFLELATRPEPEPEQEPAGWRTPPLLERLAEGAHVVWCRGMLENGYAWGGSSDTYLRDKPALQELAGPRSRRGRRGPKTLVPYAELTEDVKEQNRDLVRDIPRKLALVGYILREARTGNTGESLFELPDDDVERLAEDEHERWLFQKLRSGARYGSIRDDRASVHPAVLPWNRLSETERRQRYGKLAERVGRAALPEEEREKDRVFVRQLPDIVGAAGYEIVKLRPPGVVVGVTGHRTLTDLRRVRAGVDEALRKIEEVFPDQPLTVLSALAEGADRIVAERVLTRPDARLAVALPLPKADYLRDFGSRKSKRQFEELLARARPEDVVELSSAGSRDEAYDAAGAHVLDCCDVLVAVWDGRRPKGRGGTGGAVRRGRERRLPIAWVHAAGQRQGEVTFERLG